jgi:hypothetical protein
MARLKSPFLQTRRSGTPKYILNPDYLGSEEWEAEKEEIKDYLSAAHECVEDYFPEDYGKGIPESGAWIMLLMSVHVGKETTPGKFEKVEVPHLSIWFALPTVSPNGYGDQKLKKAIIQHPKGEVHVFPHEYTIVSDLSKYLEMTEEEGFYINFLSETSGGFDPDKLLYIMSRGIPKAVAQRMLLPELRDPFFCYFTFHPDYSAYFGEGFGTPYLTAANHKRRAAARRERVRGSRSNERNRQR